MRMVATAYCDKGTTDSGTQTRRGTIAADPRVLPPGAVVKIGSPRPEYSGTYTITDTGAKIKGRKIGIFMPNCAEAKRFGKRVVHITVVRPGPEPGR
jgi:3D (Asp-Asp-Asp) domain-containing protein